MTLGSDMSASRCFWQRTSLLLSFCPGDQSKFQCSGRRRGETFGWLISASRPLPFCRKFRLRQSLSQILFLAHFITLALSPIPPPFYLEAANAFQREAEEGAQHSPMRVPPQIQHVQSMCVCVCVCVCVCGCVLCVCVWECGRARARACASVLRLADPATSCPQCARSYALSNLAWMDRALPA